MDTQQHRKASERVLWTLAQIERAQDVLKRAEEVISLDRSRPYSSLSFDLYRKAVFALAEAAIRDAKRELNRASTEAYLAEGQRVAVNARVANTVRGFRTRGADRLNEAYGFLRANTGDGNPWYPKEPGGVL